MIENRFRTVIVTGLATSVLLDAALVLSIGFMPVAFDAFVQDVRETQVVSALVLTGLMLVLDMFLGIASFVVDPSPLAKLAVGRLIIHIMAVAMFSSLTILAVGIHRDWRAPGQSLCIALALAATGLGIMLATKPLAKSKGTGQCLR